jgi:hypothetical protein
VPKLASGAGRDPAESTIQMAYTQRPYRHTITKVTEMCGTRLIVLGTYATIGAAVRAAKKANKVSPDDSREIRRGNWGLRNRYAHGDVQTWSEEED